MRPAPQPTSPHTPDRPATTTIDSARAGWLTTAATIAALLAGCATPLPPAPPPSPPPPVVVVPAPQPSPEPVGALSYAKTPREYRRDAAAHLYGKNNHRIFKGPMPPLLYAVGTLEVDLDPRGMVTRTSWMRAPHHAPEVMADIERSVRAAAPYPVAVNLGHVTYTDTWLWHKSGTFQLDTLTEGQDANVPEPGSGRSAPKPVQRAAVPKPKATCKNATGKC